MGRFAERVADSLRVVHQTIHAINLDDGLLTIDINTASVTWMPKFPPRLTTPLNDATECVNRYQRAIAVAPPYEHTLHVILDDMLMQAQAALASAIYREYRERGPVHFATDTTTYGSSCSEQGSGL